MPRSALQRASGLILNIQRSSLYLGAGANAVAAGTVNIPGLQYNLNVGETYFAYLVNAPLTHGASTYILPILGAGGAFVFPEDTRPATLLQTIADYEVTTFFAPPTMIG